jgi:hypothetical protein
MRHLKIKSLGLSLAACVALALALTHCSPVANSISKYGTYGPTNPNGKKEGDDSLVTSEDGENSAEQAPSTDKPRVVINTVRVFRYKTSVVQEPRNLENIISVQPPRTKIIQLSEKNFRKEFDQLRETGQTSLKVADEEPPVAGQAIFLVDSRQVNPTQVDLAAFESDFRPGEDSLNWELSVLQSTQAENKKVAQLVLENLESVTLILTSDSKVIEPSPSPSPSPTPTASPTPRPTATPGPSETEGASMSASKAPKMATAAGRGSRR